MSRRLQLPPLPEGCRIERRRMGSFPPEVFWSFTCPCGATSTPSEHRTDGAAYRALLTHRAAGCLPAPEEWAEAQRAAEEAFAVGRHGGRR